MSIHIPQSFVMQFKDNVMLLSQQKGSKLRGLVREEEQTGIKHAFDRIGPTQMQEKTVRHQETPQIDTIHDRRWVNMRSFGWGDLVDREDRILQLINPLSPMTQTAAYAAGRQMDDLIIEAFGGPAEEGQFGGTPVAFPTATQTIVHGGVGLTVEKIHQVYRMFEDNDVDMDMGVHWIISPQAHEDMKTETEITSGDFVSRRPLESGSVGYWGGFNFVVSTRLPKTGTTRKTYAWVSDGMGLAVGADVYIRQGMRMDRWDAQEVFLAMSMAAARVEDVKVVEIEVTEA